MMNNPQDYINEVEGEQKEVFQFLNDFILSFPEMEGKIRYKVPFYFRKSWICYLNPIQKTNKMELAFLRGNELSNEQGVLNFKGRKQVAGMEFSSIQEIDQNILGEILQEAILLDETLPYTLKRRKSK